MLIRGPNKQCTIFCVLKREYTLSQGPSQECTLSKHSVCGRSSGCFPEHCWRGSSSAFVLLRDTLSGHIAFRCAARADSPGRMLCEGACQLYDLLKQVLFIIRVGRAWMECVSLSNGSVMDSGREI
ncbi:hypothetical protein EV1_019078 [Malus domestica]